MRNVDGSHIDALRMQIELLSEELADLEEKNENRGILRATPYGSRAHLPVGSYPKDQRAQGGTGKMSQWGRGQCHLDKNSHSFNRIYFQNQR